jgi:hypothetical protein
MKKIILFTLFFFTFIALKAQKNVELKVQKAHPFEELIISSDSKYLISTDYNSLKIWDLATTRLIHDLDNSNEPIATFALTPDDEALLVYYWSDYIKLLDIWDIKSGKIMPSPTDILSNKFSELIMKISKSGKYLVLNNGFDFNAKILDLKSGRVILTSEKYDLDINNDESLVIECGHSYQMKEGKYKSIFNTYQLKNDSITLLQKAELPENISSERTEIKKVIFDEKNKPSAVLIVFEQNKKKYLGLYDFFTKKVKNPLEINPESYSKYPFKYFKNHLIIHTQGTQMRCWNPTNGHSILFQNELLEQNLSFENKKIIQKLWNFNPDSPLFINQIQKNIFEIWDISAQKIVKKIDCNLLFDKIDKKEWINAQFNPKQPHLITFNTTRRVIMYDFKMDKIYKSWKYEKDNLQMQDLESQNMLHFEMGATNNSLFDYQNCQLSEIPRPFDNFSFSNNNQEYLLGGKSFLKFANKSVKSNLRINHYFLENQTQYLFQKDSNQVVLYDLKQAKAIKQLQGILIFYNDSTKNCYVYNTNNKSIERYNLLIDSKLDGFTLPEIIHQKIAIDKSEKFLLIDSTLYENRSTKKIKSFEKPVCLNVDGKSVLVFNDIPANYQNKKDSLYISLWDIEQKKYAFKYKPAGGNYYSYIKFSHSGTSFNIISEEDLGGSDECFGPWHRFFAQKTYESNQFLEYNSGPLRGISKANFSTKDASTIFFFINGQCDLMELKIRNLLLDKSKEKTFKRNIDQITNFNVDLNERYLITSHQNNSILLRDIQKDSIIAIIYFLEDNNSKDFIITTPDQYYFTTKNGTKAIHFIKDNQIYLFDQFDLQYNRPDIILERIGLAPKELIDTYKKAYEKRLKKQGFNPENFEKERSFNAPQIKLPKIANNYLQT